jgi:hypothetical protein
MSTIPQPVCTRTVVRRLLAEGWSRSCIAEHLGVTKGTVSYHARRVGAAIDERCARRYDWAAVQRLYDMGVSIAECERAFGFSRSSWHAAVGRGVLVPRPHGMPFERLLAAETPRSRGHLKRRLLGAGLLPDCCDTCGLVEWRGAPLSLALHHRNGVRDDNRLENLQLLCPNCHSQTDTFSGRNRARGRGA